MGTRIELTGRTFGKWRVIGETDMRSLSGALRWHCQCDCGVQRDVISASLLSGASKSCGSCSRRNPSNLYRNRARGVTLITCTDGAIFSISTSDLPLVRKYQWWADDKGYVKTKLKNKTVLLSRLLLGVEDAGREVFVDHISGDPKDNRRENLRLCLPEENIKNRKLNATNSTGFKGVSYHRKLGKYMAGIRAGGGKTIYLGCYLTPEEAAAVYDRAALLYHGEFARTNAMLGLL